MAVPKQHRSKSRQGQRRSHLFLKGRATGMCPKCKNPVLTHTVCENCGFYRDRAAIDVMAKLTKKEQKAKERELAKSQAEEKAPQGELSAEQLSRQNP